MVLGDLALRLKQAKDVRWLSNQAAVDALYRSIAAVLTSLDREAAERNEPNAVSLKVGVWTEKQVLHMVEAAAEKKGVVIKGHITDG